SATDVMTSDFEASVRVLELRGRLQRLPGDLVLLRPELLEACVSFLINAARDHPEGLGIVREDDAVALCSRLLRRERVFEEAHACMGARIGIDRLVEQQFVPRRCGDGTSYLLFPSECTRSAPDSPTAEWGLRFEGAVLSTYAVLVLRLDSDGEN